MPNFSNFPFSPYRNYIPYQNPNFNSNIVHQINQNEKINPPTITNNTIIQFQMFLLVNLT